MPIVRDVEDFKRLRETLRGVDKKERLLLNRRIRDRQMGPELQLYKSTLAPDFQNAFIPFQDPEPDETIRDRKHILAANDMEFEVLSKSSDPSVLKQAQAYEEALEALAEALFTPESVLDECDGLLGDGRAIRVVYRVMGDELKGYADREALKRYAEGEPDPTEQDGEGRPKIQVYNRQQSIAREAYKSAYERVLSERAKEQAALSRDPNKRPKKRPTDPHDEAYDQVTEDAMRMAPLPWKSRIADPETTWTWIHDSRVTMALEDGYVPVHPTLQALSNYGVTLSRDGQRWVLKREGEETAGEAGEQEITLEDEEAYELGMQLAPADTDGNRPDNSVRWSKITTLEEVAIYVEHPGNVDVDEEEPGFLLKFPNQFFGRTTGYYVTEGDTKLRSDPEERYQSPVQAMLTMAQANNFILSGAIAMIMVEATRSLYRQRGGSKQPPVDTTQERRANLVKSGSAEPSVEGGSTIERVPGFDNVEPIKLAEFWDQLKQRFRTDEFFSGSGTSSETGIHLARLQTAFLTKMQPYQKKRAARYKQILEDIVDTEAEAGRTLYIPYMPKDDRDGSGEVRVAEPREITPDMSRLPVDFRITIGSETPETKYAREQASRSEVDFGARSMTTHREIVGYKDPDLEDRRQLKDELKRAAIRGDGQTPGWMTTMIQDEMRKAVQARMAKRGLMPASGTEGQSQLVGPNGEPISSGMMEPTGPDSTPPGTPRFNPPVQTDPVTGQPIAPGANPGGV